MNLLKDQELYAENPALEMFEPAPQLPSQQPKGQQAPAAPPAQALPAQLSLSPQGESVLANSLKESVAAQSKVVDKLFDEMRELSRKIDQKQAPQQQALPPIVLNMQQGNPGSNRPIVMDLPSSGPQAEGFPRYASADMEEDEQDSYVPGPGVDSETPPEEEPPRERAAPPRTPPPAADGDDEVELEEVPEDLESESTDEEPPPVSGPPRGLPGFGPITDAEPEPEIATDADEEATLEALEEAPPESGETSSAQPPPEATAPLPPPQRAPSPKRSSDDVRKELRDYLDGVRDKLAKGQQTPTSPGDLLDYLGKLSDYLPERDKKRFRGSNERLAMESLKAQLAGKKGLRRKVADAFPPTQPRPKVPLTRSRVVDTFSYLKDLAAWHPDKAVGAAMRDRIESIVARMGRSG